jgi:hypothetical protein
MGRMTGKSGCDSWQGRDFFLNEDSFPGVKQAVRGTNPQLVLKVKDVWTYTATRR